MSFVFNAIKSVVGAVIGVVKTVVFGAVGLIIGAFKPKGNAKNQATDGRLSKSLEPEDFRKIIFGETALASDLRFWEIYGAKNDNYAEVLAAAGHRIESFGDFYIEDELVTWSGNAATGKYAGVLYRTTNTGAPGNAALAVGAGTYWDSTSKFTGTAHYALRWIVDEKKLPGGVPSRYTHKGKGALVYDPRKDSTRGGSGTHRAEDQSTWAYATVDSNGQPIGRNNALQMLWYLIGWRIQNPSTSEWNLVCGRGVDLNDINWAEWIAAANDAEARGYYTDMILSTGDSHEQNENIISADGLLGELLDPGGLWTYKVTKDDTADIAVDLGEDDVLEGGDVTWVPQAKLGEKFNEVAGNYIDPAALYQSKAYPTVKDASYTTADGFKKRSTHSYQCVQDVSLAQKLSRIKLNRTRFTGEFSATFGYRALKAQVWSIIRLTVDRYGFNQKLFRVLSQSITESGIEMVLREEHASVYAAGTVTVPSPPSSYPNKYDTTQTVALTTLAGTAFTAAGTGSTVEVGIRLSWDALPGNVRRVEVEYKPLASGYWASTGTVGGDKISIDTSGLLANTAYQVRARTWTIHEVPSAWQKVSVTTEAAVLDFSSVGGPTRPEDGATKTSVGSNELADDRFDAQWTLTAGAARITKAATSGFAAGSEPYCLEITPDATLVRSATASKIPVVAGQRYYFSARVSRGTTLSTNCRLNIGGDWLQDDGVTVVSAATEAAQQSPGSLTAGAIPTELRWSQVAPAGAAFFVYKVYCPAAATPSGAFRVEAPRVSRTEAGAGVTLAISGPSSANVNYDDTGTTIQAQVDLNYSLSVSGATVTTGVTWSYTVITGTVNGFTSASGSQALTGAGATTFSVTAMTTASAVVRINATYGGVAAPPIDITLTRVLAAPPAGGSGSVSKTSGFTAINTATFTDITGTLTLTTPAGKTATSTAVSLSCQMLPKSSDQMGPWNLEFKLQRLISSTWTDIGTVQNSDPDPYIDVLSDPPVTVSSAGTMSATIANTGLTANTSYSYRIVARMSTGTPSGNGATMRFTGSVSITCP